MRFIHFIIICLIYTISSQFVMAQNINSDDIRNQIADMRKERKMELEILSSQEKENFINERRIKLKENSENKKNLIQEKRTKRQDLKDMTVNERKEYHQERRKKWNTMSQTEKDMRQSQMVDRWSKLPPEVRARRKEKFNAMPEERKEAFKRRYPEIYADLTTSTE